MRAQLFEERFAIYKAFTEFVEHCICFQPYHPEALTLFNNATARVEFLFGEEILRLKTNIVANAIALRHLRQGVQPPDGPTEGISCGYFKGSTALTSVREIDAWFVKQHLTGLKEGFLPYLGYGDAGVDETKVTLDMPDLPPAPLIKRPVPYEHGSPSHPERKTMATKRDSPSGLSDSVSRNQKLGTFCSPHETL